METPQRIPLHDLPLEQFLAPGTVNANKTPRKHKRPLSPSRITLLNPAKRRVLDAEGIPPSNVTVSSLTHLVPSMPSNIHTMTPTRPSRLGNGFARNHWCSQRTPSPLPSHCHSHSRGLYAMPTIESSTDPQSRHYPGFDVFRDSRRPVPRAALPSDGNALTDRSEEDKENVPPRRKAKKLSSKKRLSSGLDGLDVSASAQTNRVVVQPERIPFSARWALR